MKLNFSTFLILSVAVTCLIIAFVINLENEGNKQARQRQVTEQFAEDSKLAEEKMKFDLYVKHSMQSTECYNHLCPCEFCVRRRHEVLMHQ